MLSHGRWMVAALAAALLLTGCGGDAGGSESPREGRQDVRRDAPGAQPVDDASASEAVVEDDIDTAPEADAEVSTSVDASDGQGPAAADGSEHGTVEQSDNPWAGTSAPDGSFFMPSGNVACGLGAEWVACQILERQYVPAPVFPGCAATQADTILLRSGERPEWICSEHSMFSTARELSGPTLEYGETYRGLAFTCDSDSDGVVCEDGSHGFRLARGSYDSW